MGLFNGLLGQQDNVTNSSQVKTNTPSVSAPQPKMVEDAPIKDEPKPPTPPAGLAPDHLDVHRDATSMDTLQILEKNTPPSAPSSSYSSAEPFPQPQKAEVSENNISMQDLQSQLDIINSFRKNPSVEALVALMYHQDEYMNALKTNTLGQLLENIRKYNPLVRAFNESKK